MSKCRSHRSSIIDRTGRHRTHSLAAVVALVTLVAASACGGSDDRADPTGADGSDSASSDSSSSEGAEGNDVDLDVGGVEIDGDDASVEFGDAEVGMGSDLDTPDWLPDFVQLPSDLSISMAIDDPSTGERVVSGAVADGDVDAIMDEQVAMMTSAGYEHLGDSGAFVKDGETPVEIDVTDRDGAVVYEYTHSFETEQTLRDAFAPIEGTGTLTAVIGSEEFVATGDCTVRSRDGQFTADDDPGETVSLTVELREGEQNYLLGNVVRSSVESFESWSIMQTGPNGEQPEIFVESNTFGFDGFMTEVSSGASEPATLEVVCDG